MCWPAARSQPGPGWTASSVGGAEKYQPAIAVVHVRKPEDVAEERASGLGSSAKTSAWTALIMGEG